MTKPSLGGSTTVTILSRRPEPSMLRPGDVRVGYVSCKSALRPSLLPPAHSLLLVSDYFALSVSSPVNLTINADLRSPINATIPSFVHSHPVKTSSTLPPRPRTSRRTSALPVSKVSCDLIAPDVNSDTAYELNATGIKASSLMVA